MFGAVEDSDSVCNVFIDLGELGDHVVLAAVRIVIDCEGPAFAALKHTQTLQCARDAEASVDED
jgi:hypothetical protein